MDKTDFLITYGSTKHLDKLVDDKDWGVRSAVASNPRATKEHLDKLVDDKEWPVLLNVARNPNATKEHLKKLETNSHESVSSIAKEQLQKRFPE